MKIFVVAGTIALAGCTITNSPRMRSAGQSVSPKSVEQIAGCIALKLSGNGDLGLKVEETPTGKRLTSTLSVSGMKFVQTVANIENLGDARRVSVDQLVSKVPAGSPVQPPLSDCL